MVDTGFWLALANVNLPMDLAGASLVILAEHLGHGRILSSGVRGFNVYNEFFSRGCGL